MADDRMDVLGRDSPHNLQQAAEMIEAGCDWMAKALGKAEAERDLARERLRGAVSALDEVRAAARAYAERYPVASPERDALMTILDRVGGQ